MDLNDALRKNKEVCEEKRAGASTVHLCTTEDLLCDGHTKLCSVLLCFSWHFLFLPSHILRLNKQKQQVWMS